MDGCNVRDQSSLPDAPFLFLNPCIMARSCTFFATTQEALNAVFFLKEEHQKVIRLLIHS